MTQNQAVPSSRSTSSGSSEREKRRGQIVRSAITAIFVLYSISLSLQLTLKPHSKDSTSGGIVHESLKNFDKHVANEAETPVVPVAIEDDSQASMYDAIDRSRRIEIPDKNRTLAFVHIGKSGGSTISLLLRNGCVQAVEGEACEAERWKKFPGKVGETETIASQRIQFYLHTSNVDSGKLAEYYARVSSVVLVARDPLDRWISAFLFRHPDNIDALRERNASARDRAERHGQPPPIWAGRIFGVDGPRNDQIHR